MNWGIQIRFNFISIYYIDWLFIATVTNEYTKYFSFHFNYGNLSIKNNDEVYSIYSKLKFETSKSYIFIYIFAVLLFSFHKIFFSLSDNSLSQKDCGSNWELFCAEIVNLHCKCKKIFLLIDGKKKKVELEFYFTIIS